MEKLNQKKLNKILAAHETWLETYGKQGERANLYRANLEGTNLKEANLKEANLKNILTNRGTKMLGNVMVLEAREVGDWDIILGYRAATKLEILMYS